MYLIVGLGNPGKSYEDTRHNIGFKLVDQFAKANGWKFKPDLSLKGSLVKSTWQEKPILLLKPMTYMNLSGEAVRSCVQYFKVSLDHLLVVSDDIDLPFRKIRLRKKGSSSHNGLRSVAACLHTQEYPRLRIGVGAPVSEPLEEYVLQEFSTEERAHIPQLLTHAAHVLEIWLKEGIDAAMRVANPFENEDSKE